MEYTEEQKQGFITEFATKKKRQLAATIPFVAVVLGAFVFSDPETGILFGISPLIWIPAALLLVAGMVAFAFTNWRCPACNKYLGKGFNPAFCPKCGVQLKGN